MTSVLDVQVNLGNMYYCGVGVAKDLGKAKELFALAANRDKNAAELLAKIEKEIEGDKL